MTRLPSVLLFGSSTLLFSSVAAAQTPVAYSSPQPVAAAAPQESQPYLPSPVEEDEPADRFGGAGYVVLSVEQLFGFNMTKIETEPDEGSSMTEESSGFSFLGGPQSGPYTTPHVGLDFFLGNVATLGGSVYLFTRSSELEDGDTTVSYSGFYFNPRAGVFFGGPRVGFWGRGGFALYSLTSESEYEDTDDYGDTMTYTTETTSSGAALTLDAMLAINLTDQVAVTLGPSFFIPLSGSYESTNSYFGESLQSEGDQKVRTIAANVGLSVAF